MERSSDRVAIKRDVDVTEEEMRRITIELVLGHKPRGTTPAARRLLDRLTRDIAGIIDSGGAVEVPFDIPDTLDVPLLRWYVK